MLAFLLLFFSVSSHCFNFDSLCNVVVKCKDTIIEGLQFASNYGSIKTKADMFDNINNATVPASIASTLNSSEIVDGLEKVGSGVGTVSEKLTWLQYFQGIGTIITLTKGTYELYHWSRKNWRPTEKEQLDSKNKLHSAQRLHAENALIDCLFKKHHDRKNLDGFPCDCEQIAKTYAQFAGFKAYNEMKSEYKKYSDASKKQ